MKCCVCGQPVPPELSDVGLCGPCCTGEADYDCDNSDPIVPACKKPPKQKCPHCGKMFDGLNDHIKAKHGRDIERLAAKVSP